MADFNGTPGDDVYNGTEDNDTAHGNGGNDTLNGNGGTDFLYGDDGNDTISGGDGIDYIIGGAGLDMLSGDAGDDYFTITAASDLVAGERYDGGAGFDIMSFQFGTGPVDLSGITITGVEGLQAMNAYLGTVSMTAAQLSGFTRYLDVFSIQLTTGGSVTIGSGVDGRHINIFLANAATMIDLRNDPSNYGSTVTGGSADDIIYGSSQYGDHIDGGSGNDSIYGGSDRDGLNGSDGNDHIEGGGNDDRLNGGNGNDDLYGDGGYDVLQGGLGLDRVYGGDGDDSLVIDSIADLAAGEVYDGGAGSDTLTILSGGTFDLSTVSLVGVERLSSTYGTVVVSPAQLAGFTYLSGTIAFSTSGTITLNGSYGNANFILNAAGNSIDASGASSGIAVTGSGVADTVTGSAYNDYFSGGGGVDTLNGGAGDDTLIGGAGADILHAGAGNDVLLYNDATDLSAGEVIDGGGDFDILRLGMYGGAFTLDLTSASVTGIEGIDAGPYSNAVRLTAAQFDALTAVAGNFTLTTGGAITMAGVTSASEYNNANGSITLSAAGNTLDMTGYVVPFTNIFGQGGNDVVIGSTGADNVYGGGGDDVIDGQDGDDTLRDGDGLDRMTGGAGNDSFVVERSSDVVAGELFDGGSGTDTITLSPISSGSLIADFSTSTWTSIDAIDATFGTAKLTAAQLDGVTAVAGNITLAGAGSVSMAGVSSIPGRALAIFTLSDQGNTFDLTGYIPGSATVYGGASADTIIGASGNDVLYGGGGADNLYGGTGNDTFYVDRQNDVVFENTNEGTDTVISTSNFYLYANIENLTLAAGAGNIFGVGNELANNITGNEGDNTLLAGAGADIVHGGAGVDIIYGEDGADQLFGDANNDVLIGGNGDDVMDGGAGGDSLYGEAGNDTLYGGTTFEFDRLVGGDGNDVLHGDSGNADFDHLYGNAGDDSFYVDTGDDLTFEQAGEGTDTVYANVAGANNGVYLYANIENLVLLGTTRFGVGNGLANTITGNGVANLLLGGDGNDVLNGKAGNDVLFGEAGADTFVFEHGTGGDVIGDFVPGTDRIDLTAIGYTWQQVQNSFHQNGNDLAIDLGNGDLIVLNGVNQSQLHQSDFILAGGSSGTAPIDSSAGKPDVMGSYNGIALVGDDIHVRAFHDWFAPNAMPLTMPLV